MAINLRLQRNFRRQILNKSKFVFDLYNSNIAQPPADTQLQTLSL
jgi:hypothetical protein